MNPALKKFADVLMIPDGAPTWVFIEQEHDGGAAMIYAQHKALGKGEVVELGGKVALVLWGDEAVEVMTEIAKVMTGDIKERLRAREIRKSAERWSKVKAHEARFHAEMQKLHQDVYYRFN